MVLVKRMKFFENLECVFLNCVEWFLEIVDISFGIFFVYIFVVDDWLIVVGYGKKNCVCVIFDFVELIMLSYIKVLVVWLYMLFGLFYLEFEWFLICCDSKDEVKKVEVEVYRGFGGNIFLIDVGMCSKFFVGIKECSLVWMVF